MLVVNFLKKHGKFNSTDEKSGFDMTSMYLVMAVLYCFECPNLEGGSENGVCLKGVEEMVRNEGLVQIWNELEKSDFEKWHVPGIKSVMQFAYYVFLSGMNAASADSDNLVSQQLGVIQFEEDQRLIDSAIDKHVFAFMNTSLIKHDRFHAEKYFVERVHNLMTEFIYRMPEKIKDLKLRSEKVMQTGGGQMSKASFGQDFESSMASGYGQSVNEQQVQNRLIKVESYKDFEDF